VCVVFSSEGNRTLRKRTNYNSYSIALQMLALDVDYFVRTNTDTLMP
jgi:hypothetical protein